MTHTHAARRATAQTLFDALEPRRLLDATALLDDVYENNDVPRQVLTAENGPNSPNLGDVYSDVDLRRLVLADSADWFRFRLPRQGGAGDEVAISFRNRAGNLDLELYNGRGRVLLDASRTNDSTEAVSLEGLSRGWYMVRIIGRDGATNPNYRLTISAPTGGAQPGENPAVGEANDSIAGVDTAAPGAAGSPNLGAISGSLTLAGLTLDDARDIFRFTIGTAPGDAAAVRIISDTPFNLSLFNADRESVGFAAGYMGQTSLDLSDLAPGTYYVQVTHYVLGLPGAFDYALEFDVGGATWA